MNDMSQVVAVIPIKLNNERLPKKNTKSLNGIPLIHYVQENLLAADGIDKIYVYCSDQSIEKYLFADVEWLRRDVALDLPTANFTQIFEAFGSEIDADIYVYAHATAPFVGTAVIQDLLSKVEYGEYDSAFCATKIQDFLWQDGKPMNFDASNLPRSQDLIPIFRETSGVYVFKKSVFDKYKRRIGIKPYIREMSFKEAIDINTIEDFRLAELMARYNEE